MSPLRRQKGRQSRARAGRQARARARRQQLIERERRAYGRRRPEGRLATARSASRSAAQKTLRQVGPGLERLLGGLAGGLRWLLAWTLRLAALLERGIRALLVGLRAAGSRGLAAAERYATPGRVLVAVTGGVAACLVVSQFVAYRGVEVGQAQYSEVSTIAPPPQTDRIDAGAAHAYLLIPLAAFAVAVALLALMSGRWRLCRLVSAVGLAGIVISLAIDLPKGLDLGTAGTVYAGAKATMTEGFYAQLAASAVLVLCGWALGINVRQEAGAPQRRRRPRRSRPRPRRATSVAGGGA
jgi:hypothetical protein